MLDQILFGEPRIPRNKNLEVKVEHDFPVLEVTKKTHTVFQLNTAAASELVHDGCHVNYLVSKNDAILVFFVPSEVNSSGKELSGKNSFRNQFLSDRLGIKKDPETTQLELYFELERIYQTEATLADGVSKRVINFDENTVAFRIGKEIEKPSVIENTVENTVENSIV